ncbi:hypothetical protein OH492_00875 [Vibrio chagasii]|nr:hypothetical protein [Vibrio chagasii]
MKELLGDKLTNDNVADVIDFMLGRFRAGTKMLASVDIIQAVLANRPTTSFNFDQRVKAVSLP